jgi:hypothetical protein
MAERNSFLQRLGPSITWVQSSVSGPMGALETTVVDAAHVRAKAPKAEKLIARSGFVLKQLARLIYVSPALLILKPIVGIFDITISDYLVVAFVGIVVVFFAALAWYILLYGITYFIRGRGPRAEVTVAHTVEGARSLGLLPEGRATTSSLLLAPGSPVHVRGIATALSPNAVTDELARDYWHDDPQTPWRITHCVHFAVCPEGGAPIIVRCDAPPLLVGNATPGIAQPMLQTMPRALYEVGKEMFGKGGTGSELTLIAGREVEVIGTVASHVTDIDQIELGGMNHSLDLSAAAGGPSPYRDSRQREGMVVVSASDTPVVILLG